MDYQEAIVNVVVARTDQSQAEARKTVDNWVDQYQQTKQKFNEMKPQAKVKAKQVAEDVTSAISKAAGFFGLIIGAAASGAGGIMGMPKHPEKEIEYA